MDRCLNVYVLSCTGSFCLGLQVGVKNIPKHNNNVLVLLGRLRDLACHLNYHEHPIYLHTMIKRHNVYLSVENIVSNFRSFMVYFSFLTYFRKGLSL